MVNRRARIAGINALSAPSSTAMPKPTTQTLTGNGIGPANLSEPNTVGNTAAAIARPIAAAIETQQRRFDDDEQPHGRCR